MSSVFPYNNIVLLRCPGCRKLMWNSLLFIEFIHYWVLEFSSIITFDFDNIDSILLSNALMRLMMILTLECRNKVHVYLVKSSTSQGNTSSWKLTWYWLVQISPCKVAEEAFWQVTEACFWMNPFFAYLADMHHTIHI